MLNKIGITVKISPADQTTMVNNILAGQFDAAMWSQHPGLDPDLEYVFWHGGLPTNFAQIDDPVINEALEKGRVEIDPEKRRKIYEALPKRFAEKVYNVWLAYGEVGIALSKDVHGVLSPELPDGGGPVFSSIFSGHPVHGMWVTSDE
jgi:peptide/nickel transport system substrate-binding protein